ncbi:MAG: efflux RND transporter periplasmic adaptor subunit [Rhizobiaceae bacterium]|jgi:HlyD family secretion protein
MRRRIWAYLGAAVLIAAGALGAWFWVSQPSTRTVFQTQPVERSDLTVEVTATGTLQPLVQVDISSELSGVVRAVLVDENQPVKKGDVLAELDTARLAAQVEGAEASAASVRAQINQAKTTLDETQRTLDRTQQLAKKGTATSQSVDTALAARDRAASAVSVAEAQLQIAEAQLRLQQTDLSKTKIYAPIDGIVLTRSVDPGQTVASSLQAPVLFVIAADLRKMELKAAIDEADIGMVSADQRAHFTVDAFPGHTFDARIRDIAYASVTTDGVVTYDARLDVENPEMLLRPGMTATVAVVTREAKDVLTVPAAAFRFRPPVAEQRSSWSLESLFMPRMPRPQRQQQRALPADGSRTLYVLENGQPKPIKVTVGATDGDRTEIISGLNDGDSVIVSSSESRS